MKSISPCIVSLLLLTFCYQIGGHELLSDINVVFTDQLETPMEKPVNESEREIEEKEFKCLILHSLSDGLTNLTGTKFTHHEELSRNFVWLKRQTPPPKV